MSYVKLNKHVFSMAAVTLVLVASQGVSAVAGSPLPKPSPISAMSRQLPEMLPLLDAFLSTDDQFTRELTTRLPLSKKQIARLRVLVHEKATQLQSISNHTPGSFNIATITTADQAWRQIVGIICEEKAKRMFEFVLHRWQTGPADIADLIGS